MYYKKLANQFEKVGLSLEILGEPIRKGRGMDGIFQMDIERNRKGTRRFEKFRIYPGHGDNLVQVRDKDKVAKQILLMVREPEHEFEEVLRITSHRTREQLLEDISKIRPKPVRVSWGKTSVTITTKTVATMRYMLLGVDERQLFVAELTGPATTIDQARKSLGKSVLFADGPRRGSSLDRQGEWFFLKTSSKDREEIECAVRQTRTTIVKKMAIGAVMGRRSGNPHVADEIVKMPNVADILLRGKIFVRGKIRHVDHKTVTFANWREVVMNNEGSTATGTASGVFWID